MSSIAENPVPTRAASGAGGAVSPYLVSAQRAGKALVAAFPDHPNFGPLGQAFDTLNDYFVLFADPDKAAEFAGLVLEKFLNRQSRPWEAEDVPRDPWRYDDLGWWGLAALRASGMAGIYGPCHARCFTGVAELSWQPFYRQAPNVWANASGNPKWAPYAPRFDGGVWNYFFSERKIAGTPHTPACPGRGDSFLCIQNTVTNGLYWMLLARLARVRAEPRLREAADGACKFFESWAAVTPADECLLHYFHYDDRDQAVVRERVPTYFSGERTCHYDKDLAFAGDQGLVLGALVDQMALVGRGSRQYEKSCAYFRQIAQGVLGYLVDPGTQLLRPWAPWSGPDRNRPPGDGADHLAGIGAFMRTVLYAYQQNADARRILDNLHYPRLIQASADQVVRSPSPDADFIGRTNDLATLLAAIWILNGAA